MQAILNIFRGLAPLADAPEQQFEDTTTTSTLAAHDDHGEVDRRDGHVGGAFRHRRDRYDCRRLATPHCRTLRRRRSSPTQPPMLSRV